MKDCKEVRCVQPHCFSSPLMISTGPMAVVGFQVIESTIDESVANKFTCIEILSGGPLVFDAVIQFYTQDGTAVGMF